MITIDFGMDYIRTHGLSSTGAGVLDGQVNSIFPDLSKDTTDPAKYDFGPTDAYIKNIL